MFRNKFKLPSNNPIKSVDESYHSDPDEFTIDPIHLKLNLAEKNHPSISADDYQKDCHAWAKKESKKETLIQFLIKQGNYTKEAAKDMVEALNPNHANIFFKHIQQLPRKTFSLALNISTIFNTINNTPGTPNTVTTDPQHGATTPVSSPLHSDNEIPLRESRFGR